MTLHAQTRSRHLTDVDARLAHIEKYRQGQLDRLPTEATNVVAAAHRASVERILGEVRAARRRVEAGLYGDCSGCGCDIAADVLAERPWTTVCPRCAGRW